MELAARETYLDQLCSLPSSNKPFRDRGVPGLKYEHFIHMKNASLFSEICVTECTFSARKNTNRPGALVVLLAVSILVSSKIKPSRAAWAKRLPCKPMQLPELVGHQVKTNN